MEREMAYLLKLLKAFLWEQTPEPEAQIQWPRLKELAVIHGVGGILGYMSMLAPIAPEALRPELRQDCLQTLALYGRRHALGEERLQALAQLEVDTCTVKGQVLRRLYPVPELRTFNDMDILIRREHREKSHQYLLEQGFAADVDWEPIFTYTKGEEYYEVHTHLMDTDIAGRRSCRDFFADIWGHTVALGPHRYEMDREFHLVYLLCHIAKHAAGHGAGIRMYLDIAVYLKAHDESLDWQRIFAWLEKLGLRQFGCAVLSAVQAWLGAPCRAEYEPLSGDSLERFAQFTLEAGAFGHHGRDLALAELKKHTGSRLGLIFGRLFPGVEKLKNRFSYLQKRPWLLPVAWVHRALIMPGNVKQYAQEAKSIITHDEDDAQRLKDICKEIGL